MNSTESRGKDAPAVDSPAEGAVSIGKCLEKAHVSAIKMRFSDWQINLQ